MRLFLTGVSGPLAPLIRDRTRLEAELVQLGGEAPVGVVAAPGSPLDPEALREGMRGAIAVVCDLQGTLDEVREADETEPERLAEGLVLATRRLLDAARRERIRRVLVLSSARTSTLRRGPRRRALGAWALQPWPRLYALRQAEDAALEASDLAMVLAPAALLGPALTPGALLCRVLAIRAGLGLPARRVRLCLADTRDVVGAAVSALARGVPGRRYAVGSTPFWLSTFDARISEVSPRLPPPPPPDDLPVGVLSELPDPALATADLGWWTRRPGRTLRDTLAALDANAGTAPARRSPGEA